MKIMTKSHKEPLIKEYIKKIIPNKKKPIWQKNNENK